MNFKKGQIKILITDAIALISILFLPLLGYTLTSTQIPTSQSLSVNFFDIMRNMDISTLFLIISVLLIAATEISIFKAQKKYALASCIAGFISFLVFIGFASVAQFDLLKSIYTPGIKVTFGIYDLMNLGSLIAFIAYCVNIAFIAKYQKN